MEFWSLIHLYLPAQAMPVFFLFLRVSLATLTSQGPGKYLSAAESSHTRTACTCGHGAHGVRRARAPWQGSRPAAGSDGIGLVSYDSLAVVRTMHTQSAECGLALNFVVSCSELCVQLCMLCGGLVRYYFDCRVAHMSSTFRHSDVTR